VRDLRRTTVIDVAQARRAASAKLQDEASQKQERMRTRVATATGAASVL
jgi:hypothetical protein